MRLLAFLLPSILLFIGVSAEAKRCFDTFWLYSQAEVNAFSGNGCTETGKVEIGPSADIVDLSPLGYLRKVQSLTVRENQALVTLVGLEQLEIGNNLMINDNPELVGLDGLQGVQGELNNLTIYRNAKLTNIDALAGITAGWSIVIVENPQLINIDGLRNLSSDKRPLHVSIDKNTSLDNLDGLASVSEVTWLGLHSNTGLTSIEGLANLHKAESITISDSGLTSLRGLENLQSVEGWLEIVYNDNLVEIQGLNLLTSTGRLLIAANDVLQEITGFTHMTSTGQLRIPFNRALTNISGLGSLDQVLSAEVSRNPFLANCAPLRLLFTRMPSSAVKVEQNAEGCNSLSEITQPSSVAFRRILNAVSDVRQSLSTEKEQNSESSEVVWSWLPRETTTPQSPKSSTPPTQSD